MKRLIAVLVAFALPAGAACYVALAPFGGGLAPLDALAERIVAALGRSYAVPALLALAVVLALLAALVFKPRRARQSQPELELLAAWTPEPVAPEPEPGTRAANLRRRALPGDYPAPPPAAPAQALPLPAPVILMRKPRERSRDWFGDTTWLGGLPRLGPVPWPRDAGGRALPFAAQIDLAQLHRAAPGSPLPQVGSLAFFLGTGAVVAVPEGAHDFTDPPGDLPPAFDEGGAPFPAVPNRLSRWFFPFWPAEPVALDLPEALRDHRDPLREIAVEEAMATQLERHAAPRDHPFYAAGVGAPVEVLWWHSVIHLADQLHEALEACARPLAVQHAALERKRAELHTLHADPDAADHAQLAADYLAAEVEEMEAQCAELPAMVEALDHFVAGREPWARLTPEEQEVVADILPEVHERFGELVRFHVPGSLAALATLSMRALVSGPPETLAALPDEVLERINQGYRLPPVDQHQMFGLPAGRIARDRHRRDLLLLQLGYDDMMEWCWSEAGRYQFWIGADDAEAGNWSAASLTFESD